MHHEALHESGADFIQAIIRQEAEVFGLSNLVLGGFSQGCATALHVLMNFEAMSGGRLSSFYSGTAGPLPFANSVVV